MNSLIYIVDDDSLNVHIISLFLDKHFSSSKYTCFENIESIKKEINNNGFPDFVISDYNMPGKNGVDFVKWLESKNYKDYILWTNNQAKALKELGETKINAIAKKDDYEKIIEVITLAFNKIEKNHKVSTTFAV